jgi:hypothetical protein
LDQHWCNDPTSGGGHFTGHFTATPSTLYLKLSNCTLFKCELGLVQAAGRMLAQPLLQHPSQIAGSTQQVRAKPSHRLLHDDNTLSIRLRHCQTPAFRQSDYQQQQEQEQEQRVDGEWLHEPAECNLPPGRRYNQACKTKRPTRKPRLLDGAPRAGKPP